MKRFALLLIAAIAMLTGAARAELVIDIAYLGQKPAKTKALSNLEPPPKDGGLQGARLAIKDNNTTGRFLKQKFNLAEKVVRKTKDAAPAFQALYDKGLRTFVLNVSAAALDQIRKLPSAEESLLFNAGALDNRFRNSDCSRSMLHTLPSRAMLADALTQYLVKKRWKNWFMIVGPEAKDQLAASALKRAAKRFGAKIVAEKTWDGAKDVRRTAQAEVPLLTQGVDYDVLVVADEDGLFGEYLMYRTWKPQIVAGTQGLFATGWFWTIEQWGAAQLQRRFKRLAKRRMTDKDYAAWAAVRSIGEAATRIKSASHDELSKFIRSDAFQLAAFKGRKLSYRGWNGQLRQPIAVTAARSLVSYSPQEGFLHQHTDLNTLGFDRPESTCK